MLNFYKYKLNKKKIYYSLFFHYIFLSFNYHYFFQKNNVILNLLNLYKFNIVTLNSTELFSIFKKNKEINNFLKFNLILVYLRHFSIRLLEFVINKNILYFVIIEGFFININYLDNLLNYFRLFNINYNYMILYLNKIYYFIKFYILYIMHLIK